MKKRILILLCMSASFSMFAMDAPDLGYSSSDSSSEDEQKMQDLIVECAQLDQETDRLDKKLGQSVQQTIYDLVKEGSWTRDQTLKELGQGDPDTIEKLNIIINQSAFQKLFEKTKQKQQ